MKINYRSLILVIFFALPFVCEAQHFPQKAYSDQYRPQIHYSPKEHWVNDPNGMVYYNGNYHLFYQYFPGSTIWGPMHWGHAISKDLMHWKEQPIALYPDSLGYIFSGSAVIDQHNTSGFGKNGKAPMVAIFTHHDPKGEKAGTNNFQNQSIAYSLDEGKTWTKYAGNPVLKNPGIKDFRDPKVMWYAPQKKWVMTLATLDRITFYSSPNLKTWSKESDFGKGLGAHGGVWECPDLFPLNLDGKTYWVLIVNLNPGGPNGGSATQYFIGQFNGNKFTTTDVKTKWVDYGPDEYAGITWSNTGARKIFLGWMSNWNYANQVPTERWRNAMTIPRELALKRINGDIMLASEPVKELNAIAMQPTLINANHSEEKKIFRNLPAQYELRFTTDNIRDLSIKLSNDLGEEVRLGYKKATNQYFIDRSKSGKVDFNKDFAKSFFAPRLSLSSNSNFRIIVDASSIELFADNGLSVMTCILFPKNRLNQLRIQNNEDMIIKNLKLIPLKSIWR